MHVARRKEGRIKPMDVTSAAPISLTRVRQLLQGLVRQGEARADVTVSGAIVYLFPDLLVDDVDLVEIDPLLSAFEQLERNEAEQGLFWRER